MMRDTAKSLNKEIGPWGELEEDNNHLETYLIAMVMWHQSAASRQQAEHQQNGGEVKDISMQIPTQKHMNK